MHIIAGRRWESWPRCAMCTSADLVSGRGTGMPSSRGARCPGWRHASPGGTSNPVDLAGGGSRTFQLATVQALANQRVDRLLTGYFGATARTRMSSQNETDSPARMAAAATPAAFASSSDDVPGSSIDPCCDRSVPVYGMSTRRSAFCPACRADEHAVAFPCCPNHTRGSSQRGYSSKTTDGPPASILSKRARCTPWTLRGRRLSLASRCAQALVPAKSDVGGVRLGSPEREWSGIHDMTHTSNILLSVERWPAAMG